jgi:glycine/D-amino acid oxidase-like deaminating enzyme
LLGHNGLMQTCDVAVIGAGIVGAACAYEMASSGLRVTVVEPNEVVSGSTNLGYGSLSIGDDASGLFELTRYGLFLWNQLAEYLPEDCAYRRGGSIWIAVDEADFDRAFQRAQLFNQQGVHAELLDGRHVAEAEPALGHRVAGGLYVPDEGWFLPGRAAEFLLQLALQNGAKIIRQKALQLHDHEVTLNDESILYAGNIVNAAGIDATGLTPGLALEFSKGHLMAVQSEATCTRHQISAMSSLHDAQLDVTVRFEARQTSTGEVWIGSSQQKASADSAVKVEPKIIAAILRQAIDMIPVIGNAHPLRSWAGLRSAGTDGLPLIGPIPGKGGILAATGHAAYGATAALSTAKLIADEILSRTPAIDPKPYRPDRFEGKTSEYAK